MSGDHEEAGPMTTAALATGKLGKLPVRTDVRNHGRQGICLSGVAVFAGSFDAAACPQIGSWPAEALSCL